MSQQNSLVKKSFIGLLCVVFALCIISLVTELLPEVEAKIIVVPTLILASGLLLVQIKRTIANKDNTDN